MYCQYFRVTNIPTLLGLDCCQSLHFPGGRPLRAKAASNTTHYATVSNINSPCTEGAGVRFFFNSATQPVGLLPRRSPSARPTFYLARPHVRHSEWAEEDHLKSAARFCWWGRRTLPHDGSPPSGARVERGRRQQRHAAPPVARCACASGPGSRKPPALAGAGSLRAVCGSASSPQTPSAAPDGRRAPLARAAATFRSLQKVSSLPACGIFPLPATAGSISLRCACWARAPPARALLEALWGTGIRFSLLFQANRLTPSGNLRNLRAFGGSYPRIGSIGID